MNHIKISSYTSLACAKRNALSIWVASPWCIELLCALCQQTMMCWVEDRSDETYTPAGQLNLSNFQCCQTGRCFSMATSVSYLNITHLVYFTINVSTVFVSSFHFQQWNEYLEKCTILYSSCDIPIYKITVISHVN